LAALEALSAKLTCMGDQAVNDAEKDNKERDREIAENEAERQVVGDVRVSVWAIAGAVIIGLAAVGWVLIRNH
jgi:hypothetical protein